MLFVERIASHRGGPVRAPALQNCNNEPNGGHAEAPMIFRRARRPGAPKCGRPHGAAPAIDNIRSSHPVGAAPCGGPQAEILRQGQSPCPTVSPSVKPFGFATSLVRGRLWVGGHMGPPLRQNTVRICLYLNPFPSSVWPSASHLPPGEGFCGRILSACGDHKGRSPLYRKMGGRVGY